MFKSSVVCCEVKHRVFLFLPVCAGGGEGQGGGEEVDLVQLSGARALHQVQRTEARAVGHEEQVATLMMDASLSTEVITVTFWHVIIFCAARQ